MRKLLIGLLLSFFIIPVWGQNQNENLVKYWKYRDRLRKRFIVVNENVENYGVNIPAAEINYDSAVIKWGDANSNMSHYLSVLATELWLLKNNNQDYSTTLKELYYAMMAMERMDTYSEYSLRWRENIGYWIYGTWIRGYIDQQSDVNGFHIRDDVSQGFWYNYKGHFDVSDFSSSFNNENMEAISQDNIFHNIEGLALVSKLVGTESVSGIPVSFVNNIIPNRLANQGIQNGSSINFSLWAKDFVKRYIGFMQNDGTFTKSWALVSFTTHWLIANPITNQLVEEGNGSDLDLGAFTNHGVINAGLSLTGEDLRQYNGILSPDATANLYEGLFRSHGIEQIYPGPIRDYLIANLFGGVWFNILFDDYHLRSLSCVGNILGTETFSILRNHRDNYSPYIYEHFPLMYLTLNDPDYNVMALEDGVYNTDQVYYENLLNSAPLCGPSSDGVHDWSSTSRCVWPESLGQNSDKHIEYSGLDYMMLHNLYYIAFRKEDYKNLTITTNYTNQNLVKNAGMIDATNTIVGGYVTYKASNTITLKPGFNAKTGTNFMAFTSYRQNNYHGDSYKIMSAVDCKIPLKSSMVSQDAKDYLSNMSYFFEPMKIPQKHETSSGDIISENISISIFPNPSTGIFNVELKNSLFPISYNIINVNGIIVNSGTIYNNMQQIDFSSIPKGIYIIRFNALDKTYIKKLTLI